MDEVREAARISEFAATQASVVSFIDLVLLAPDGPDRADPAGRVAVTAIACLLTLCAAALVWPPHADAWSAAAWIDAVRAEQRRVLEEHQDAEKIARALSAIRADRFAELLEHLPLEEARAVAAEVPLLGVDPDSGRIVPFRPDGTPLADDASLAAHEELGPAGR